MRKLTTKDKKKRLKIKAVEKQHFIFKSIAKNKNFFSLIRLNAFFKLISIIIKTSVSNRCVYSINKKSFNKSTIFSRHIFLKLIRAGNVAGMRKTS